LSPSGLSASPTANASKTITLKTGAGFNLDNSTTDITKNGAYMVIAPGTHTLTIRYWVKSETDNVEAHITKNVFKKQKIDLSIWYAPESYSNSRGHIF
jgi:lipoprotein